jgi:hypothetical protein
VAAPQRAAEFRLGSPVATQWQYTRLSSASAFFVGWMIIQAFPGQPVLVASGITIVMVIMVMLYRPTRLAVGVGGLTTSWFGRKRFMRYEEIEGVARYSERRIRRIFPRRHAEYEGLEVTLRSGTRVRHLVTMFSPFSADPHVKIETILERIEEAMHARAHETEVGVPAGPFRRSGRRGRAR